MPRARHHLREVMARMWTHIYRLIRLGEVVPLTTGHHLETTIVTDDATVGIETAIGTQTYHDIAIWIDSRTEIWTPLDQICAMIHIVIEGGNILTLDGLGAEVRIVSDAKDYRLESEISIADDL